MIDFLHLPSLTVTSVEEGENDYHVEAETTKHPRACRNCGAIDLVGFGRKQQVFLDIPSHGKRVGIHVDRRRYRCRSCGTTVLEPLSMMDEKRTMTNRLIRYVQDQSLKRTFTSVADDIGVDEKTVRNIFHDHVKTLEATYQFLTPSVLGIDEIHLLRPRCVLANVEERTIFNILQNRNKSTVEKYLLRLPDRQEVELVAIDMWAPYRDACRLALPWAPIIIDKFHVVRMASQALDDVRKRIREDMTAKERRTLMHDRFVLLKRRRDLNPREAMLLDIWTSSVPDLGTAYDLKERFYDLWDVEDAKTAKERYETWTEDIPVKLRPSFQPILTAMTNWETEIFAYFEHPITNAYTEALNGLIRIVNRAGRGYSFEALRAKMLYTEGMKKTKRPRYDRRREDLLAESAEPYDIEPPWGVAISTLTELLQQGRI